MLPAPTPTAAAVTRPARRARHNAGPGSAKPLLYSEDLTNPPPLSGEDLRDALSDPRIVLSNPWVTLSDPRVTLSDLRVTLSGPRVTLSDSRVALSDSRVALSDPRVKLSGPRIALSAPLALEPDLECAGRG